MSDQAAIQSVEHGNRRKKVGWWLKGQRENVALRLAPWLRSTAHEWGDIELAWREVAAANHKMQRDGRTLMAEAGLLDIDGVDLPATRRFIEAVRKHDRECPGSWLWTLLAAAEDELNLTAGEVVDGL